MEVAYRWIWPRRIVSGGLEWNQSVQGFKAAILSVEQGLTETLRIFKGTCVGSSASEIPRPLGVHERTPTEACLMSVFLGGI